MKTILPFILDGQTLKKDKNFPETVAAGSKNALQIKVNGLPSGLVAKAYFSLSWDTNSVYDQTFYEDSLIVDEYITTLPENTSDYFDYKVSFSIAVFDGDDLRLTTNPVEMLIVNTNYSSETTNTPEVPQSQYENFVNETKNYYLSAKNEASSSLQYSQEAKLILNNTANAIKNNVKGVGSVVLENVSPIEHEVDVKVYGEYDRSSVSIISFYQNLLPQKYYHVTQFNTNNVLTNGVYFNVQNDGSIVATNKNIETPTGSIAQFRIVFNSTDGDGSAFVLPKGNYVCSSGMIKEDGTNTFAEATIGMYISIKKLTENGTKTVTVSPNSPNFTIDDGDIINYITVAIPAGSIVNGLKFYPSIEEGSVVGEWTSPSWNGYTINEEGVVPGVKSKYPKEKIVSIQKDVEVQAEYNLDLNKISKKWFNKVWVCVGDSMTEANGYTDVHYFDYISSDTGINVVNMGDSGTGYAKYSPATNPNTTFLKRIQDADLTNADVLTIMGGVNDAGAGLDIGTPTDTDTTTLCGCVNATIDAIRAAEIARGRLLPFGIITSPPAWSQPPTNPDNFITKWYAAIGEICRLRGIPFLDLYHCSGLRPWVNEYKLLAYTKDSKDSQGNLHGLHPDESGHKLIAPKIKSFVEKLIM